MYAFSLVGGECLLAIPQRGELVLGIQGKLLTFLSAVEAIVKYNK